MSTTENNKLIAEFLGLQLEQDQERLFINGLGTKLIDETFNTDWNWLMEVVEKIESIEDNRFLFQISTRQGFYAEIRERFSYETKIEDAWGKTRIESVYNACVDFIKWHNEQK